MRDIRSCPEAQAVPVTTYSSPICRSTSAYRPQGTGLVSTGQVRRSRARSSTYIVPAYRVGLLWRRNWAIRACSSRCRPTPLTLKDVEPKKRTQVASEFRLASRSGREVGSSEICPSLPILPRRSGTERPPTPRGEEATESPSTRITRNSRGERLHCGLATQVEIHRRLESKVNGVECHPPPAPPRIRGPAPSRWPGLRG